MDVENFDRIIEIWQESYRPFADPDSAAPFGAHREPPATLKEIAALEQNLGTPLPPGLREFLVDYSRGWAFNAFFTDAFCLALPPGLQGIFSAQVEFSLAGIQRAEASRRAWIRACTGSADECDRMFQGKLGLFSVGNGDLFAFDLLDGKADHRVVYLSHDGGEGHGCMLGDCFLDFLQRHAAVGLCGPEGWQLLPFIPDKRIGIDPGCPNAVHYRQVALGETGQ